MNISKVSDFSKNLLIGFIVSDAYINSIYPHFKNNNELFYFVFNPQNRIICQWIFTYYTKYNEAPKNNIQEIFNTESKKLKPEDKELISLFLQSFSNKFEREKKYNEAYAIEQALLFIKEKNLSLLEEKIKLAKQKGDLEEAEQYIKTFKNVESEEVLYTITDVTNDFDYIDQIDITKDPDYLFHLPGVLGEKIGPLCRGDFLAGAGPGKRGKSWWLEEIGITALENNLNVIYFNLEMSHKKCLKRIYSTFTGAVTYLSEDEFSKEIELPYFKEIEPNVFTIKYKKKIAYGLDNHQIKQSLLSHSKLFKGAFKVVTFPANTMSVEASEKVLDRLYCEEGFAADVIIYDYLDLISCSSKSEHRHKIDSVWKNARSMSQKKHCLVVSATHTNKGTNNIDIKPDDLSEDGRKINHVTHMFGINQTSSEKNLLFQRINILAARDSSFNPDEFIVVLQNLDIGKTYLDSKLYRNIKFDF